MIKIGISRRIKVDRVFYDQKFLLEDVVVEENVVIDFPNDATSITNVEVTVDIIECDLDMTDDTVDIQFDIIKILTFNTGDETEFSFSPLKQNIPLPKLKETYIPTKYEDRLTCQVYDFTPYDTFSYTPPSNPGGTGTISDTVDVEMTIKITAEDQMIVGLSSGKSKTVSVTPQLPT